MSNLAGGKGEASGAEVLRPSPRLVEVARAYIDGLENGQRRLEQIEQDLNRLTFQCATISNHNRALQRVLEGVISLSKAGQALTEDQLANAREILTVNQLMAEDIFTCECGHSKFDHDDKGCQFTGCRPICG